MRVNRWQVATLVVPVVLFVVAAREGTFHLDAAFAGTPERFVAAVAAVGGAADARRALAVDLAFVAAWALVVPRLLRIGWRDWAPPWRRATPWWVAAPLVAYAAAALDAIEDLGCLAIAGDAAPVRAITLTITTVAWAKSAAYVASLIALLTLVLGPLTAPVREVLGAWASTLPDRLAGRRTRVLRPGASGPAAAGSTAGAPGAATAIDPSGERIGISVSGGGIRAASVALGALQALDTPGPGATPSVFRRARWMSAVSGGAYAAAGWRVSRRPGGAIPPPPDDSRDGLFTPGGPWMRSVAARHRFLDNGTLSLAGGIAGAVLRVTAVLGAVLSTAVLAGWSTGRIIRSTAVMRRFPIDDGGGAVSAGDLFQARLVVPWLVPAIIAAAALMIMFTRRAHRRPWRTVAFVAGGYAVLVAGLASLAPAGIHLMPGVYRHLAAGGGGANRGAGIVGLLTSLGVFGALIAALRARLKRTWMFLGGWLLLAGWIVLGGKIADTRARGLGGLAREIHVGALAIAVPLVAVLWLVAVDSIPSHRLTLGGIYRKRLAATFALAEPSAGEPPGGEPRAGEPDDLLPALGYHDEPAWPAYVGAAGPELLIAATAHASGRRFTGLPAYGFTFTPSAVTLFDTPDGTGSAVAATDYPTGSWWRGYPRGWVVTRSMALTGAAFASAMGRQALGTTNALLAALNVRLGAWVPNPRHAHWFTARSQPRVHLGYLAKEILGRYHPERDPFVYVADGGHRENLGLVELLRMHPSLVITIDASGDRPGSFSTLAEALELAELELDVTIDIDLAGLRADGRDEPVDCTAEGTIHYPPAMGGGTARFLYGRSQLSERAPHELTQFGAADPRFPDYSTGDQYLTDDQFAALVRLGAHVGERLTTRVADVTA
jgi:hypothetical protein